MRRRKFCFAGDKVENTDGELPALFPGVDFEDELADDMRSPLPRVLLGRIREVEEEESKPKPKKNEGGGDDEDE